jgi:hypothetical protein
MSLYRQKKIPAHRAKGGRDFAGCKDFCPDVPPPVLPAIRLSFFLTVIFL